jgi:hypothetical protein
MLVDIWPQLAAIEVSKYGHAAKKRQKRVKIAGLFGLENRQIKEILVFQALMEQSGRFASSGQPLAPLLGRLEHATTDGRKTTTNHPTGHWHFGCGWR